MNSIGRMMTFFLFVRQIIELPVKIYSFAVRMKVKFVDLNSLNKMPMQSQRMFIKIDKKPFEI